MFRSRLAEGYLRTRFPGIDVSSSGVDACDGLNGHVCWYAQCIADCGGFASRMSSTWNRTAQEHLENASIVVALDPSVAKDLADRLVMPEKVVYQVWNIPDVVGMQHDFGQTTELLGEAAGCWSELQAAIDGSVELAAAGVMTE